MASDINKIAANVQTLQGMGLPASEIERYLAHEGLSPAEFEAELRMEGAKARPRGVMDNVRGGLGALAQGATLGWADELGGLLAGAGALLPGGRSPLEAYQETVSAARQDNAGFKSQNPATAALLEGVGSVAPVAATMGAAAPQVAGGGMLKQAANMAGQGAAWGALAGQGYGEGNQAIQDAATGAVLGGAVGAATPMAGDAIAALRAPAQRLEGYVNRVAGGIPSVPAPPSLSGAPAGGGPEQAAVRRALGLMDDAGVAPSAVREAVGNSRATGVPTMIADVAGVPSQRALRGIRTADPGAAGLIDQRLGNRAVGQLDRASGQVEAAMGAGPIEPGAATEALATLRQAEAGPMYRRAYGVGEVQDLPLVAELQGKAQVYRPLHEGAVRTIATTEGRTIAPLYDDAGNLARWPTVEDVDLIKQGADARLYNNRRGAVEPSNALDAKGQYGLQQTIRGEEGFLAAADAAVPEYAVARQAFAGRTAIMDAVEQGQDILKLSPGEIRATVQSLGSEQEREMFRGSAVQAIQSRLMRAADRSEAANVLSEIFGWGQGGKREQLRALFNDDLAFAKFEAWAKNELNAVRTRRAVTGGSNTADKLVDVMDVTFDPASVAIDVASGGWGSTAWRATREALRGQAGRATRYELADNLTTTSAQQADDFLRAVEELHARRIAAQTRNTPAGAAVRLYAGQD